MAFLSHGHEQTVTYKVTSILLEAALLKALYHWSFSVSPALHWEEILWISKNMTILVYHLFLPFRPIQYQTRTNEFRLKSCQFVFNHQMRNLVPRSKGRAYLCIAEPYLPYLFGPSSSEPTYLHLPYLLVFQRG